MLNFEEELYLGSAKSDENFVGFHITDDIFFGSISGPSYIDVLLSGVSQLVLTNAVELNYLKLFGGTEQRNLPSGYTQVKYLESTGTQYIDTGITPTINTKAEVKFAPVVVNTTGYWGSRVEPYRFCCTTFSSGTQFGIGMTYSAWPANRTELVLGRIYDCVMANGYASINGIEYTETPVTSFDNIGNFYLGVVNNIYSQARYYTCKLWENDLLVFNGIPAKNPSGVIGMYDTVSGTFLTNAGSGTFTAGADTTPSPDNPMDIVCNNGALKCRMASGLPLGYTKVEYLESSGTQYIDTGIKPTNTFKIDLEVAKINLSRTDGICGSYNGSQWGMYLYSVSNGRFACAYGVQNVYVTDENYDDTNKHHVVLDLISGGLKTFVDNNLTSTNPYSPINNNINYYIFRCNDGDASTQRTGIIKLYSFKIYDNNILVRNLVPCKRNSDNVLGMYDTVTGDFLTNSGTGTFIAGAVDDNIEVYVDGTQETVTVHSKNLFNKNEALLDTTVNENGLFEANNNFNCSNYIPVKYGRTYMRSNNGTRFGVRYHLYDGNKNWLGYVDATITGLITVNNSSAKYVAFAINKTINLDNVQVEQGSTVTDYEPYFNGGSALAENLLKVSTYQDVQEVLTGSVTRNVGVKVFDGTESWEASGPGYFLGNVFSGLSSIAGSLCTHFTVSDTNSHPYDMNIDFGGVQPNNLFVRYDAMTTLSNFKQFLADQYNAGTPVILVYPLATATTETVTGQTLTASGNCTVTATGSLNNLELELSYKQEV